MAEAVIKRLSDSAFLMSDLSLERAQALRSSLAATGVWREVVQGLNSVAVTFDPTVEDASALEDLLVGQLAEVADNAASLATETIDLPTSYGGKAGPDMAYLEDTLNLGADEIIRQHARCDHTVSMIGFVPGFAYVGGLDASLRVDRMPVPRSRVPDGSVGISGLYTGLYPLASPGGWPLIGRVQCSLVDYEKSEPFLLRPGMRVRFVPV